MFPQVEGRGAYLSAKCDLKNLREDLFKMLRRGGMAVLGLGMLRPLFNLLLALLKAFLHALSGHADMPPSPCSPKTVVAPRPR